MFELKTAISKVVPIVLIVALGLVVAAGYVFVIQQPSQVKQPEQVNPLPQPPQPQQPAAPQQPPRQPQPGRAPAQDPRADSLSQTVVAHLGRLAARDVRGLMEAYIPDKAYAEWGGQAGAFAGRYDGTPNIRILWAQIVGNTVAISYKIANYDATIDGDKATVRYTLNLNGTGKLIGDFDMNIDAIQKFVFKDGKWLMDNDLWVFRVFRTSVVADATVFPLHWKKRGDFSVWDDRIKDLFPQGWR